VSYSRDRPADPSPPVLTERQRATLTTVVDTVFPPEPDGVSGSRIGVVHYIERRLDTPWGDGSSWYNADPHEAPVDPSLGWQSSLRPADAYRTYLDAIDRWAIDAHGTSFDQLAPEHARTLVASLEDGSFAIACDLPPTSFFTLVCGQLVEGIFRHPHFGGNVDGAGWAWLLGQAATENDDSRSISSDFAG
jgi:gluconate 2-dehydrogenase gamma chain